MDSKGGSWSEAEAAVYHGFAGWGIEVPHIQVEDRVLLSESLDLPCVQPVNEGMDPHGISIGSDGNLPRAVSEFSLQVSAQHLGAFSKVLGD